MRINRVEGFQPYDEYVEQRQGSAFEFLDLLGLRYERLQADRSLLLRRVQVFNAQLNENEISLAQWTADAALFVVLGPYYAAHVVVEIAHPWLHGEHSVAARSIWLGCLLIGVALFISRRESKHRALKQRISTLIPKRKTMVCFVFVALVVAGFYYYESGVGAPAETISGHKD